MTKLTREAVDAAVKASTEQRWPVGEWRLDTHKLTIALNEQLGQQAAAPGVEHFDANVMAFLLGEGPLDGVWFGDRHPTEKGAFWWRKHLRALAVAPPPQSPMEKGEIERLIWLAKYSPDHFEKEISALRAMAPPPVRSGGEASLQKVQTTQAGRSDAEIAADLTKLADDLREITASSHFPDLVEEAARALSRGR